MGRPRRRPGPLRAHEGNRVVSIGKQTVAVVVDKDRPNDRPRAIVFVHEHDAIDYARDVNMGDGSLYVWVLEAPIYAAWTGTEEA